MTSTRTVTGLLLTLLLVIGATAAAQQELPNNNETDSGEHHDGTVTTAQLYSGNAQRELLMLDSKAKERYFADPPGFRKHPSYYSESYLPRGREISEVERKNLNNQWGAWKLVDTKRSSRPGDDFYTKYTNRDVPFAEFPANAWQKDTVYLGKFLTQATDLTKRAMEAILAEYGKPPANPSSPEADFDQRSAAFAVQHDIDVGKLDKTTNWMPRESFEGLKRRLLHSVMTEDSFNLVMGGHSAAAAHGNHFQQSYTLQYGRIMEPIFARLGVKGTASNMGMGGMGTMHNALGAGDIYGRNVDVLVWDSGMTEKGVTEQGIFATQGLLGSHRAPFLWFDRKSCLSTLHTEIGADVGVYGNGRAILTESESFEALDGNDQTWATRYMACSSEIARECKVQSHQYNGTCWIDRSTGFSWHGIELEGYTPVNKQKMEPGGRASWHPGNHVHQLQGRVLSFVILLALHEALTEWKQADNYQLPDEAWHVTEKYKSIHAKVSASPTTDAWCEAKDIPMAFCRVSMSARTENTPRNRPWETNIRSLIKSSPQGDSLPKAGASLYDPPDVYNPLLDPPVGEIDVLSIVENGVDFAPNLARIRDSSEKMTFQEPIYTNPKNLKIEPGKGWGFSVAGSDNCDGQYDSFCKRGSKNACLLYSHNDGRENIEFDGFSGWMIFNIPKLEHGVIMFGIFDWIFFPTAATEGWCSENNKEPCTSRNLRSGHSNATASKSPEDVDEEDVLNFAHEDEERESRRLKPKVPPYCDDFKFEYAINGAITTLDLEAWNKMKRRVERVVQVWPIKDDPSIAGDNVELAIRMTGCGRQKIFGLTHIYFA